MNIRSRLIDRIICETTSKEFKVIKYNKVLLKKYNKKYMSRYSNFKVNQYRSTNIKRMTNKRWNRAMLRCLNFMDGVVFSEEKFLNSSNSPCLLKNIRPRCFFLQQYFYERRFTRLYPSKYIIGFIHDPGCYSNPDEKEPTEYNENNVRTREALIEYYKFADWDFDGWTKKQNRDATRRGRFLDWKEKVFLR